MAEPEVRSVFQDCIAELTAMFEASTQVRERWRCTMCWVLAIPAS